MELGSRPARETAKVPDNQSGAPGAGERSPKPGSVCPLARSFAHFATDAQQRGALTTHRFSQVEKWEREEERVGLSPPTSGTSTKREHAVIQ